MKTKLLVVTLLTVLTALTYAALVTRITFSARGADADCLYVAVDPNTAPFPIDRARIAGRLLKFVQAKAGPKWAYAISACDPEGDAFSVELLAPPPDFTLTANDAAGTFIVSGTLPVGVNYYYFRVVDAPNREVADPCEAVYTLVVRGQRGNKPSILRWLFQ